MKRRMLFFLTALILCLGFIKATDASASEYGTVLEDDGTKATGPCGAEGEEGNTLTWTIYKKEVNAENVYTLVISGTGAMKDYEFKTISGDGTNGKRAGTAPWYNIIDENGACLNLGTMKLVIEEGVTHIGDYAFKPSERIVNTHIDYEMRLNGKLTIPKSVKSIGSYAFAFNNFSGDLIIPDNVTQIGDWAFGSARTTNGWMFENSNIVIGTGITSVGSNVFSGYPDDERSSLSSTLYYLSDVRLSKSNDKYLWPKVSKTYTLTRHYDDGAMTVTSRIVLPDGVADADKYPEYAKYHTFPNELDNEFDGLSVTWYTDKACTQPVGDSVSFTGDTHFYGKSNKAGEFYASEVVASGECGAEGSNLEWKIYGNETLNDYVLVITGSGDMKDYSFYNSTDKAPWIKDYQYVINKVLLPSGITRIGSSAFSEMIFTECKIPDTVKSVGERAFYNCGNFAPRILILPESIEEIGWLAFKYGVDKDYILLIGTKANNIYTSTITHSYENFPYYQYQGELKGYLYNFSQVDIAGESGFRYSYWNNVSLHTITMVCGSKTTTRKVLPSTALPVNSYPEADYPELVKYRTFPSELDTINGTTLTWYSDVDMTEKITTPLTDFTGNITVYAACPGHKDEDGDAYCDFCGEAKKLTITGAIQKEILLTEEYTVPEWMYLVDGEGNRVTRVTDTQSLKAVIAITSAGSSLSDSIAMNYKVKVAKDENVTPEITFGFCENTYQPAAKELSRAEDYVEYQFTLSEILPQQMCESIIATVTLGDKEVSKNYSVQAYCMDMLNQTAEALGMTSEKYNALKTLAVDMLYYGDEAQKYAGMEATTTSVLTVDQQSLRSSDSTASAGSVMSISGEDENTEYQWKSANLWLQDRIGIVFSFTCSESALMGLTVQVGFNDDISKVYNEFQKDGNGRYYLVVEGIPANQYDSEVTATFFKNEARVGKTVTYSVASYVNRMKNDDSLKGILRAIYDYGTAAKAYQQIN